MVFTYQDVHSQAFGKMVQELSLDLCVVLDMGLWTNP